MAMKRRGKARKGVWVKKREVAGGGWRAWRVRFFAWGDEGRGICVALWGSRGWEEGSRVEGGVVVEDFGENGDIGEGLAEDLGVGDGGGVEFVFEVVEDEALEGEAAIADGFGGEESVVEGAEAVGDDEEDGEIEHGGEVGDGLIFGEGDFPAADTFDEDEIV
jgi:hypothetical protein